MFLIDYVLENFLKVYFRLCYNFTALTNGPHIYKADVPHEITPTRGICNNNKELPWLEVDLVKPIHDTKAVLYIMVNDFLLHMNYRDSFNHVGRDSCNRIDQYTRSAATFTPLELSDIANPKRPFPRDCENANFQSEERNFQNAFFTLDGKEITMSRIDNMCKHVSKRLFSHLMNVFG